MNSLSQNYTQVILMELMVSTEIQYEVGMHV